MNTREFNKKGYKLVSHTPCLELITRLGVPNLERPMVEDDYWEEAFDFSER